MKQKDSQPLSTAELPPLAASYVAAARKVYGVPLKIPRNMRARFVVFEDDLREKHIPVSNYAETVMMILQKWCASHNLKYVPINVFTGEWALSRFMKVWTSQSVTITTETTDDELLHSELLVARLYVAESLLNVVRLSSIVESCRPMLSQEWCDMYESKDQRRNKFVKSAIKILCQEYNIADDTYIDTYRDLVNRLL